MRHAALTALILSTLATCTPTGRPADSNDAGSSSVEVPGSGSPVLESVGSSALVEEPGTSGEPDPSGGGSGSGATGELSGASTGEPEEPCPPCPGLAECEEHETPDGICEDVCDVLDLACDACGLTPADCGFAHWLCSQGDDPCGWAADKGSDQAAHLCACAMACDPPAPLV